MCLTTRKKSDWLSLRIRFCIYTKALIFKHRVYEMAISIRKDKTSHLSILRGKKVIHHCYVEKALIALLQISCEYEDH